MEVFNQRLKDEFNMDIVMTTPSVPYIINYHGDEKRGIESSTATISCVSDWPVAGSRNSLSFTVMEPMVKVSRS
jgi:translation elongation factor EF-4